MQHEEFPFANIPNQINYDELKSQLEQLANYEIERFSDSPQDRNVDLLIAVQRAIFFLENHIPVPINSEAHIQAEKQNNQQLREFFENLEKDFSDAHPENATNQIAIVKACFYKAIKFCLIDLYTGPNDNPSQSAFTEKEIDEIVNITVIQFLIEWLKRSENTRQTIYSFQRQPYALKEEQERSKIGENTLSDPQNLMAGIRHGIEKYRENVLLQNEQAKMEGQGYQPAPEKTGKREEFSFIALCFAYFYSQRYTELYNILFKRKKPWEQSTKDPNKKRDIIKGAYCDFNKLLTAIETPPKKSNNSYQLDRDRAFTIKSLFFYEWEYTHRFLFVEQIAKYMRENDIDIDTPFPEKFNYYYQRFPLGPFEPITLSPFITKYDLIIPAVYQNKLSDTHQNKILAARTVINKIYSTYLLVFPEKATRPWTQEDFKNAATFLQNDFRMSDVLSTFNWEDFTDDEASGKPPLSEYIKKVFLHSNFTDSFYVKTAHDTFKANAEKINKRPPKQE